jgi:hypothetical protein
MLRRPDANYSEGSAFMLSASAAKCSFTAVVIEAVIMQCRSRLDRLDNTAPSLRREERSTTYGALYCKADSRIA